ncbi:MAG: DUF1697 domain-containing protein [Solirubrobacteraceae bacterium]
MPAGNEDAPRIAALLRGINVGGRNKIPMAELRGLVAELGFLDIATHLQSGNVVFRAPGTEPEQAAAAIEAAIARRLGLNIAVLARTGTELERIVSAHPLAEVASNPSRMLVVFLSEPVERTLVAQVQEEQFSPDRFVAAEQEIYVWAPNGVSETKLTYAFWEKQLGGATATARNWNTVQRLLEMTQAA